MGLGVWWSSGRARTAARRGASSGSHGSALLAHARAGGGREGEEEDGCCLVGPRERPSKEQVRGGRGTTTHLATTPWLASSVERESWCELERLRERDGQGRREGMTSGPWVTDGSSGHRKKKMMTTMDS